MKKIVLIVFTVLLNTVFLSCNPESITDETASAVCCGESGEIPPPPPTGNGG